LITYGADVQLKNGMGNFLFLIHSEFGFISYCLMEVSREKLLFS
jgi:hypothetical protein